MTLAEIGTLRSEALAAYQTALKAASYTINSGNSQRSITRQKLNELRENYEYWNSMYLEESGESRRVKFITPRY